MAQSFDREVIVIGGDLQVAQLQDMLHRVVLMFWLLMVEEPIGSPLQCGELVPTNDEMRRLCPDVPDMDDLFQTPDHAISRHSKEMHIVPPSGKPLKFDFDGYVLNRVAHDEFLVQLAKNQEQIFSLIQGLIK